MKLLALIVVCCTMSLVISQAVSSKELSRPSAATGDYRIGEPLRGSTVGNTLARACGNCHSNETRWPWYSQMAPISWWIENHVREGRAELNFSQWPTYSLRRKRDQLESICGVISMGKMPPATYQAVHPEARLAAGDKEAVCAWAKAEIKREKLAPR